MTPLTHLPDNRVMCPQCRVTFRLGWTRFTGEWARCSEKKCKRRFWHGGSLDQVRMHIDPADMEAGLA